MIAQALDIKDNCMGIFANGSMFLDNEFPNLNKIKYAWKYSPLFKGLDCEYLFLLSRGEPLESFSKEKEKLKEFNNLFESHRRANLAAKVDMSNECFYNLFPAGLLEKYFLIRERALKSLRQTRDFEEDKDILYKAHILSSEISNQTINYGANKGRIKYNIFGTKTGRFTNLKSSVPILTMKKEERKKIRPKNDLFLELDFNAAELRTLLSLQGCTQPSGDLHQWNISNIYSNSVTRDTAKKRIFAWLYNPEKEDQRIENFYKKKSVQSHFWNSGQIKTPYGRKIEVEEKNSLNYLLQSTTNDIVVENAFKIMNLLQNKESFVSFTMHDSVVLDFSRSEIDLLSDIKEAFVCSRMGRYPCNIAIGKNYNEMRKIDF